MLRKRQKTVYIQIAAAVLVVCTAIYQMKHISGMTIYPDEFGYWANAAQWLGYDWSGTAALQSYYSFGYSMVLLPLLAMIKNPLLLYKTAVMLNVIFVYLHAVILFQAACEFSKDIKPQWFCALMAACYPSLLFYMQFTMTESLLNLLFMLSIWLLLKFEKTGKVHYCIFMVCVLGYMFFVHMRTIGILTAGVLIGIISLIRLKKNIVYKLAYLAGIFIFLAALILMGNMVKELLQSNLYVSADKNILGINDFSGQLVKVRYLLTADGIKKLAVSSIGKLFYLGLATCGTFYFGVWGLLKRTWSGNVYRYIALSAAFTFFISALYTMDGGRADTLLYGRYNEIIIPIIVYLGLCEMLEHKKIFRSICIILVMQGMMAYVLLRVMSEVNPAGFQGYFVIGISYALQEIMPIISDYVLYPYFAGSVAMCLLALVLGLFIRRKQLLEWYLCIFIGLYLYTALSAGNKYIYDHSLDIAQDMDMMQQVNESLESEDIVSFLLSDNDAHYIDILQFCLREKVLEVLMEDEINVDELKADYVFTYHNSIQEEALKEKYGREMETFHFKLYYDGT